MDRILYSSRKETVRRTPWYRQFFVVCAAEIMCLLLAVAAIGQEVKSGEGVFLEQLKDQAQKFLDGQRFSDMLDYLSGLRAERTDPRERFYLEYYTALTKSQYLDHLDKQEDWQHYYALVHAFDAEIIDTAAKAAAENISQTAAIDMQYLAWKAYLREEDEAQAETSFNELVKRIVAYTASEHDLSKIQETAALLSQEGKTRQLGALFAMYKEYLLNSKAAPEAIEQMAKIAAAYAADDQMDMARVAYEHYLSIIIDRYAPADCIPAMLRIAGQFRHHQFRRSLDAEFAEKIYAEIETKFGEQALGEAALFARAYNLYARGEYERADEEFNRFVRLFPASMFAAEAYTRLGIVNRYFLAREEPATASFRKVMDEFPDSGYAPLCTYQSALSAQFQQDNTRALEWYGRLTGSAGAYAAEARARCAEINTQQAMAEAVSYPLEHRVLDPENATIVLTLLSDPSGVFIGNPLFWKATAQDFSAGTVQPLFRYQWFWDTGSNEAPGNVPGFETSYSTGSPKLVCFSAKTGDNENLIFADVWVYDLVVISPASEQSVPAGTTVQFSADIDPATIDAGDFNWQWQISGPESFSGEGAQFSRKCEQPGRYQGRVTISGNGVEVSRPFVFDVAVR
ncbi:MAG: hypothetical protein PHO30_01170 [Candidatus Omnitrophica bacterium]|nr:hypothetical protein [Candidatus Omnitrophota bacterium]